jgi:hypothetical protein
MLRMWSGRICAFAAGNICDGSIPSINQILLTLFPQAQSVQGVADEVSGPTVAPTARGRPCRSPGLRSRSRAP